MIGRFRTVFRLFAWYALSGACEFLLDPVCPGNPEVKALFDGKPGRRVTAFKVFVEGKYKVYVRPTIGVTVRAYPPLGGNDE